MTYLKYLSNFIPLYIRIFKHYCIINMYIKFINSDTKLYATVKPSIDINFTQIVCYEI